VAETEGANKKPLRFGTGGAKSSSFFRYDQNPRVPAGATTTTTTRATRCLRALVPRGFMNVRGKKARREAGVKGGGESRRYRSLNRSRS
jgi:hypothetical protein